LRGVRFGGIIEEIIDNAIGKSGDCAVGEFEHVAGQGWFRRGDKPGG